MRKKTTISRQKVKLSAYLDTSVPGAFLDPVGSPTYETTKIFWESVIPHYEVYISDLVEIEIADLKSVRKKKILESLVENFDVLPVSKESAKVAQEYLKLLRIPERDAIHIAIASIEKMDYLVTWNMQHIARERTRRAVDYINLTLILKRLVIYTPLDFLEEF